MRYAEINAAGEIENVAEWDGRTPWSPPEGLRVVEVPADVIAEPGGRLEADGTWTRAPEPPEDGS